MILANKPFLTGDKPVYADYALCGVIGNFLFPGNTSLPENCLMLEAWYTKMRAGNFRSALDDMQLASQSQFSDRRRPVRQIAHPRRRRRYRKSGGRAEVSARARPRSMSPPARATPRFIWRRRAFRSRPAISPPAMLDAGGKLAAEKGVEDRLPGASGGETSLSRTTPLASSPVGWPRIISARRSRLSASRRGC